MKFLVDAQLPPVLAAWLRGKGYDAVHVEDVGLRDSDDVDIRAFAAAQDKIVVTNPARRIATARALGTNRQCADTRDHRAVRRELGAS